MDMNDKIGNYESYMAKKAEFNAVQRMNLDQIVKLFSLYGIDLKGGLNRYAKIRNAILDCLGEDRNKAAKVIISFSSEYDDQSSCNTNVRDVRIFDSEGNLLEPKIKLDYYNLVESETVSMDCEPEDLVVHLNIPNFPSLYTEIFPYSFGGLKKEITNPGYLPYPENLELNVLKESISRNCYTD